MPDWRNIFSGSESIQHGPERLNEAQTRIKLLEEVNGDLQEQITRLEENNSEGRQQLMKLEEELRRQNLQTTKLEDERRKLKRMIINANLDNEEPIDIELEQAFGTIRGDIQKLVHYLNVRPVPLLINDCREQTAAFYETFWGTGDLNMNRLRLRAQIFEIVKEKVFAARCFGLEGDMGNALAKLESKLDTSNGTQKRTVAAWRKLTIQCINMLGLEEVIPNATADMIIDLIHPLVPHSDRKNKKIYDLVDNICVSAYALTVKFRQSRSTYRICSVEPGTILAGNELDHCQIIGREGSNLEGQDISSFKVSCTVFGAMVKHDFAYGEELVLESAQVVCAK